MGLRTQWRPGDTFLVRHKDAHIVVVEKKAGILTHATDLPRSQTESTRDEPNILDGLRRFLDERAGRRHLKAVHRLDRVVSGLLVFSRTEKAFQMLKAQFADRSVERSYVAVVEGHPPHEGCVKHTLDVEPMTVRVVGSNHPQGRMAITHFEVRETLTKASASLVGVKLETGLRNQIRVQMTAIGHPLLGERKYSPRENRPQGQNRIFLHAEILGFTHPTTGQTLRFEAPLPPDLRRWLAELRHKNSPRCPAPRFKKNRRLRRPK